MLNRDVTKSAVIIIIAVCMGATSVRAAPANALSGALGSPPAMKWKWENVEMVVTYDIFVPYGEVLEIRNSTIMMDSSHGTIGIRVAGVLLLENSTIKSISETGYYFEVYGVGDFESSNVEGVRSIDPIGEGLIASSVALRIRNSTLDSIDDYAITYAYVPHAIEDFIINSDIHSMILVSTQLSVRNSTLGDLFFKLEMSELHLINSTYDDVVATKSAFGHIESWKYLQVYTSQPESDLTITNSDGETVDAVTTDEEGYFAAWLPSKMVIVNCLRGNHEVNFNPYTFEADKTVEKSFPIPIRGGLDRIYMKQDYYGETIQDLEENTMVEVEMSPW